MGFDVSKYKDQHEPWRPDYPPVWNNIINIKKKEVMIDIDSPSFGFLRDINIQAHAITTGAIDRAMQS